MEPILDFFQNSGVDFWRMVKCVAIILVGVVLCGLLGKFVFGRKSRLNQSIIAAVSIILLYAIAALIRTAGSQFNWVIAPLPFTSINADSLVLFSFDGASMDILCNEILGMLVLGFFVNLVNAWLPAGKNFWAWLGLRTVSIAAGWGSYLLIDWLCNTYLPGGILQFAPQILLILLVVLILVGALKLLVGVLLASVNPVIGALYTFFFANIVGRQITKSLFTTALLAGLVALLRTFGVVSLTLCSGALVAYLPFVFLLLAVWYPTSRKM